MKIKEKNIYKAYGSYYLVIGDVLPEDKDDTLVYTSASIDLEELFDVPNVGLLRPDESWQFVREATNEEFRITLNNFSMMMLQQPAYVDKIYNLEEELEKLVPTR